MTSNELNNAINKICDSTEIYESFGGKCIPYIGWFWRTVNFDADNCYLGVIPNYEKSDNKNHVGFMENNKWNYPNIKVCGDDWNEIKQLLIKAIKFTDYKNLKALDDKIQSFAVGRKWRTEYDEDGYPEYYEY